MTSKPLVSICIPTYNGAKYLSEALESAICQTYQPLEIILSDDGSKDSTLKIARSFIDKSALPIQIFKHQASTIGANWNHCIYQARGEYIKFLFQDDKLKSDCISKMMELILSNKEIGLVCCSREVLCEMNEYDNEWFINWIRRFGNLQNSWANGINSVINGIDLLTRPDLLEPPQNKIGEPTAVLLKKDQIIKIGGFSTVLKQTLDHEAWYRVISKCKIGFINEKLVYFRLHPDQASFINKGNYTEEGQLYRFALYKNLYKFLHKGLKKKLLVEFGPRDVLSYKGILKKLNSLLNKIKSIY